MADEIITFDAAASMPDGSDPGAPTNSPLSIGPGTSYPVTEASFPAPPLNVMYSSSVDTEGELPVSRRYGNRTITLKIEMDEASATNTLLDALQVKFAKLAREGGTLKRTRKDGTTIRIYDIVAADGWDPVYDLKYLLGHSSEVVMTLPARPLARGAEVDLGDNVETVLPALVFTDAGVTGDVPGLGRLVIDNDDVTNDQWWLTWGIESKNYSSSANAALFYEAEGRTAMGGSAIAAGPAGASGAGSNVMRNTSLVPNYQAVLSTQATGAGAHLSHIGTFRVYARVQIPTTNTGFTSVALEWGEGDFRRFTGPPQMPETALDPTWEGTWRLVDLGLVSPQKVTAGTQRWECRILAKSTVSGDDIDVDWLMLVPADEGSGVVSAVQRIGTPTVFSARDEFDQVIGALTGKTAPTGGVWAGAGDADDFSVETVGKTAVRTATADASSTTGRYAISGVAAFAAQVVQVDFKSTITPGALSAMWLTALARYTDTNNWLQAGVGEVTVNLSGGTTATYSNVLHVRKRVAGTATDIAYDTSRALLADVWYTARLAVDAGGRFTLWFGQQGATLALVFRGFDADLATGGVLASGKPGFYDADVLGGAATRNFDNFGAWVPVADAAVCASQSLEVRSDRVTREDSGGTLWVTPSSYVGDYLLVPPAGAEARTTRVIVKASRNVPGEGADSGTDDISARLFVTPRYL